ncbi:MAG TPA: hypothetical protein VJP84_03810 [Steroidobacteraceae bacterium]|nr:hypothetical protein [Steroidobacteraceae bacterium]
MNFRKAKVSKAAWLLSLSLGLLAPAPAPPPLMQLPGIAVAAPLAYADPPPLAAGLTLAGQRDNQRATGTCANVKRELRFEMITVDTEPYPPTWRNPAVCLAVYIPAQR